MRHRNLAVLAVTSLVVRFAFLFAHGIDSDEPQHLHVAWAWSRGLVQYRDVFDNHFPLLHLLFTPFMRLMPEGSTVFIFARLAIAPVAIACGWLLYEIARPLLGDERAAVAAIVFSVMPPWLPKSVEFRNDTLWVFFFLAALALAPRSRFLSGVAAGLCLLASVKALPLFLALALATVSRGAVDFRAPVPWVRSHGWTVLGAAIPLAIAALCFAALGALDDMLYATLFFNASLPVNAVRRIGGALAFAIVGQPLAFRARNVPPLALLAIWYCAVMLCFWPSLSARDFLPLVPLAAIALAATRLPAAALYAAMTLASVWYARLWRPADTSRQQFVDAAVRLTTSNDYVFDLKGNAVFRRRPVLSIYDIVGRTVFSNDGAPEQIATRGCCVAIGDLSHIPARTRAFLNHNFIDIGPLRVCGSVPREGAFTIAVPQTYAIIARNPGDVTIDGAPYRGPRFLAAGRHTLTAAEPVTVIWWRAVMNPRQDLSGNADTSARAAHPRHAEVTVLE